MDIDTSGQQKEIEDLTLKSYNYQSVLRLECFVEIRPKKYLGWEKQKVVSGDLREREPALE